MDSFLGRHRNLIILLGVLFLQALGLAVQVKRANGGDTENTRLIRIWSVGAISPLERAVVWVQNGVSDVWRNYFYLRGVRAENRELKEQIEQMRIEQVRLSEDAAQARRLQTLLAFKEQFISKTVAAQVIGSSGSDLSRIVYIDKGADAGLKRDMAVITADGIVGKVMQVYPSVAQVLLINDQTSGVGVILEKSRLQGILRGTANGEVVVNDVMSDEQVPVGETLLTSGGDQIFPKGLPVGTVAKVSTGKELFLNIRIKPATDLSKLEEVLVLVEKQERQATAEDTNRVRAADILAARLPSVPDKPATDGPGAPAASPGNGTTPQNSPAKPLTAGKPSNPPSLKPQAANAGTGTSFPVQSQARSQGAGGTGGVKKARVEDVSSAGASTDSRGGDPGPVPLPANQAGANQASANQAKPSAPASAQPNTQPPANGNSPQ
jgi:rod shape-determining protein MreC